MENAIKQIICNYQTEHLHYSSRKESGLQVMQKAELAGALNGNVIKSKKNAWAMNDSEVELGTETIDEQLETLEKMLKRLQWCMAVFGIYNLQSQEPSPVLTNIGIGRCHRVSRYLCDIKKPVYQMCVIMLMMIYLIRSFLSFGIGEKTSEFLALKVTIAIWTLQVTVNAILMVKGSHPKFGKMHTACEWWGREVLPLLRELGVKKSTKWMRRQLHACFIVGWFFILFNVAAIPFLMFSKLTAFRGNLQILLTTPFPVNYITLAVTLVFNVYATVVWVLPMVYFVSLSTVVNYGFKLSTKALRLCIQRVHATDEFPGCLHKQRILHLNLCKFVSLVDKDFYCLFGNWFATNVPLACFLLYQLTRGGDVDVYMMVAYIVWLGANIMGIALTTSFAASTNTAAHSALEYIHDIGTLGISREQHCQVNLFLSKLNGPSVGFTVLDLITLTKELILTIGGLYLTYFLVLWGF